MGKIDYQKIYDKNKEDWKELTNKPQKYEALLAGHYSDSNHFIYELLQNAEDAGARCAAFALHEDRLVFYHDGKPFDRADVVGVSSMLEGTKDRDSASTIGRFGMGFKSVFKYTCRPEIYSDGEAFAIENYLLPVELKGGWDAQKEKKELSYFYGEKIYCPFRTCTHLTKIVIPFQKRDEEGKIVDIGGEGILEKLESLSGEILLFLRTIKDLYWMDSSSGETVYIKLRYLDKKQERIACRIRSLSDENEKTQFYLKYKRIWEHPKMKAAEVAVSYSLNAGGTNIEALQDSPVWVYFPTREPSNLPFFIHGSFETAVSRERLMTVSGFNKELFSVLGDLIADTMEDLAARKLISQNFLRSVLMRAFEAEKENEMHLGLKKKLTQRFREAKLLPDAKRNYYKAEDLVLAVPYGMAKFRDSSLWGESFKDVPPFVGLSDGSAKQFTPYFLWLKDDLGLRLFTLSDWAEKLCELPECTLKLDEVANEEEKETVVKAKAEISALYDFLWTQWSEYDSLPAYRRSSLESYKERLYACWDKARKSIQKAPLILNREKSLCSAWKCEKLALYIEVNNTHYTLADSVLVDKDIAKEYERLLEDVFCIEAFDNFQFVKERYIEKYLTGRKGLSIFDDRQNWQEEHCEDIRRIFSLMKEEDSGSKVRSLLASAYLIKIEDAEGSVRFAKPSEVYAPSSDEGVDMKIYYAGQSKQWLDESFYDSQGIKRAQLKRMGVVTTPIDEKERTGRGGIRAAGNSNWIALGEYCPFIAIDGFVDNIFYIKQHIEDESAKKKSVEMLRLLLSIHRKLSGKIQVGKMNPRVHDREEAALLQKLREKAWLYDENDKLHCIPEISRHNLNRMLYGDLVNQREACATLGFAGEQGGRIEDLLKDVISLEEDEKRTLFNLLQALLPQTDTPSADVHMESGEQTDASSDVFNPYARYRSMVFPARRVWNRERLAEHIEREFFCADPVRYKEKLRQIRISPSPKKARQYVSDMYTNDSGTRICQMCKKEADSFQATEIANFGVEMSPLRLCLCPTCAQQYKQLRDGNKEDFKAKLKEALHETSNENPDNVWTVSLPDDVQVHFTETHLAEIQEIVSLLEEYGVPKMAEDEDE
jgi:hypothetical protein